MKKIWKTKKKNLLNFKKLLIVQSNQTQTIINQIYMERNEIVVHKLPKKKKDKKNP